MSDSQSAAPPPQSPPDTPPPEAPRRRAPRWMKIVLVISLAINLAVAGFAVAHVIKGPRFVSAGPAAALMDGRKLLWTLPRETRHSLRDEFMDRHSEEFAGYRERWNDARRELGRTLMSGDATDDEIRAAYRRLGEVEADASVRMRDILAELTLRVPRDARATFGDRMGHDHRFFGRRRGYDDDD